MHNKLKNESMKLELKHLAPYLLYGLKIQGQTHKEISVLTGLINETVYDLSDIKPILRPLSDLNPNEILLKHYFNKEKAGIDKELQMIRDGKYLPLQCSYNIINILLSEHFDVFGLIDKGLAIDLKQ